MDAIAKTARFCAAHRAVESDRSDRLFRDPLARALAGAEGFAMLEFTAPEHSRLLFRYPYQVFWRVGDAQHSRRHPSGGDCGGQHIDRGPRVRKDND